jgi:hypothetical protein
MIDLSCEKNEIKNNPSEILIMGYMYEYLRKDESELKEDLRKLILEYNEYNKARNTYLFIYAAAVNKSVPDVSMNKDDYYTFYDCLNNKTSENIDVLLETPGGGGDAAEEIAKFLHKKFKKVNFLIPGEAKSAGTILALSGNDILMTETGSLGPIDAQIRIGRTWVSAYDYMEWIDEKFSEAQKNQGLNPFDAIMVAQISPGELKLVNHSLKFAEDLVLKWLPNYKFGSWVKTEDRQIDVTPEMRKARAKEISDILVNHSKWRDHGRSIKIADLETEVKLKVIKIDEDPKLAEIVYRMHTVIRLLFATGAGYKIFADDEACVIKAASLFNPASNNSKSVNKNTVVEVEVICPKCNKKERIYLKFSNNGKIDKLSQEKGLKPYPLNGVWKCTCGNEIDLKPMLKDVEQNTGMKAIIGVCNLPCQIRNLIKKALKRN